MLEHHPLVKEFPEYQQKIHDLKLNNAHFAKLCDEYEHLDKEVFRIEAHDEPVTDMDLENLKKQRLHLKDELYRFLQKNR